MLGIIGGIICIAGDILLDYKGPSNQKLGKFKLVESNWEQMSVARFKLSIYLVTLGVPLYLFGFQSLAEQIKEHDLIFGTVLWFFASAGSIGGYFIHNLICLIPIISKKLDYVSLEDREELINTVYKTIKIPFYTLYFFLVVITSVMISYAILIRYLEIHWFFILLTPMPLLIIGVIVRKMNKKVFFDLPGIIMPSLGISMFGLMAVLNLLR